MKRVVEAIEISAEGWLLIQRSGVLKEQFCPFCVVNGESPRCGDWCPHFGDQCCVDDSPENEFGEPMTLSLCNGTVLVALGDVADMRAEE